MLLKLILPISWNHKSLEHNKKIDIRDLPWMGHNVPIIKQIYDQNTRCKQVHHHLKRLNKEIVINLVLHNKWDATMLLTQNKNSLCNLSQLNNKNSCNPWLGLLWIYDFKKGRNGFLFVIFLKIHINQNSKISS
jgi:hypothetical protein